MIPATNPTIDLFISSQLCMTLASCYDSGHDTCSWVDYGDIHNYDAAVTYITNSHEYDPTVMTVMTASIPNEIWSSR